MLQSIGLQVINKVDTRVLVSYLCNPLLLAGMTLTIPAGRFDWLQFFPIHLLDISDSCGKQSVVTNNKTQDYRQQKKKIQGCKFNDVRFN